MAPGTALHAGKDLAVSPRTSPHGLTPTNRGALSFRTRASLLAPLASRRTGITRYPAPRPKPGACPDFPLRLPEGAEATIRPVSGTKEHEKTPSTSPSTLRQQRQYVNL